MHEIITDGKWPPSEGGPPPPPMDRLSKTLVHTSQRCLMLSPQGSWMPGPLRLRLCRAFIIPARRASPSARQRPCGLPLAGLPLSLCEAFSRVLLSLFSSGPLLLLSCPLMLFPFVLCFPFSLSLPHVSAFIAFSPHVFPPLSFSSPHNYLCLPSDIGALFCSSR